MNPRKRLKQWRESAEMTMGEAAELLGCSKAHYSNVEAGESGAGLKFALEAQKHADIDPSLWIRYAGQ